jgi:hypothetical protein
MDFFLETLRSANRFLQPDFDLPFSPVWGTLHR